MRLLGPQEPASVQQAALSAARKLKADQTAVLMLEKWPELLPEVRSSVCGLLLERTAWGQQLVAALEKGTVKANDLDTAVVERLRKYGDAALQARTAAVLGKTTECRSRQGRARYVGQAACVLRCSARRETFR